MPSLASKLVFGGPKPSGSLAPRAFAQPPLQTQPREAALPWPKKLGRSAPWPFDRATAFRCTGQIECLRFNDMLGWNDTAIMVITYEDEQL